MRRGQIFIVVSAFLLAPVLVYYFSFPWILLAALVLIVTLATIGVAIDGEEKL